MAEKRINLLDKMKRSMSDVPPRLTRLLLASFGLSATALTLATYCFFRGDGPAEVAGTAAAVGGAVAMATHTVLRW